MHSLDFDESECNLIDSALKNLNESVKNTVDHSESTDSELVRFTLAYSDVINDLCLSVNERDSFTASEIKMIYSALEQLPKAKKGVASLRDSIADYCKDFKIELP